MASTARGGVLLRLGSSDSGLVFVPAEVAARLAKLTALTPVPGAGPPVAGIALADGAVVTVLEVGDGAAAKPRGYHPGEEWPVPGSDRAIICKLGAIDVAVTGGIVVATGLFEAGPGEGVRWRGEAIPVLDVHALYARAEAAIWADRVVGGRPSDRPPRDDAPAPRPVAVAPTQRPGDPRDRRGLTR